jgi:hypothetical protein
MIIIRNRWSKTKGLVNGASGALFKESKFRKYSSKKLNVTNFNALIA